MPLVIEHRSVHVEVEDCDDLRASSFTVLIWVKLKSMSDVEGFQKEAGWPCFLCKTRTWNNGFGLYGMPDGTVRFYVNEWDQMYAETKLTKLDVWTCLVATYEVDSKACTGTLCLYKDACVKDTRSDLPPMRRNDAPFCIGATMWGENGWYALHGTVGPTLVWNRALVAGEVARACKGKAPLNGLVLRLDLSEDTGCGGGAVARDSSGRGNHGHFMESLTKVDRSSPHPNDSPLPQTCRVPTSHKYECQGCHPIRDTLPQYQGGSSKFPWGTVVATEGVWGGAGAWSLVPVVVGCVIAGGFIAFKARRL